MVFCLACAVWEVRTEIFRNAKVETDADRNPRLIVTKALCNEPECMPQSSKNFLTYKGEQEWKFTRLIGLRQMIRMVATPNLQYALRVFYWYSEHTARKEPWISKTFWRSVPHQWMRTWQAGNIGHISLTVVKRFSWRIKCNAGVLTEGTSGMGTVFSETTKHSGKHEEYLVQASSCLQWQ